jgi:hypothetical protein
MSHEAMAMRLRRVGVVGFAGTPARFLADVARSYLDIVRADRSADPSALDVQANERQSDKRD